MFYRTTLILLMLALALPTTASTTATLVVGGDEVFLHTRPIVDGNKVYVPLPAINSLGAKYSVDKDQKGDGQEVAITSADGRRITCRAKSVDKELMVPIQDIARELGAVADWDERSKTLELRARIEKISFNGTEFKVNTSYPVYYTVTWWKGANRLILDIKGVALPDDPNRSVHNTTGVPIRAGLQTDSSVRLVLDMPNEIQYAVKGQPTRPSSEIAVTVSGLRPGISANGQPKFSVVEIAPAPPDTPISNISKLEFRKIGPERVEISISMKPLADPIASMSREPDRYILDIPHSTLGDDVEDVHVGHQVLEGIRIEQRRTTSRIIMDLPRLVSPEVRKDEKSGKLIATLSLPKGAGGSLAGKIVVIDPGHGGKDMGALGLGGFRESDSNLRIGLKLQRVLEDQGVVALMTRKTDVALTLEQRGVFARNHSADFFISVHSNSVTGNNCPSGIMTFYHSNCGNGRALARAIHDEIVKASGLPCLNIKSDTTIYKTGFGVLRHATFYDGPGFGIPSVLLEIGFVKHPTDVARLRDPKFQQAVADSVVRGLRIYVEGNPERPKAPRQVEPIPVKHVEPPTAQPPPKQEKPAQEPAKVQPRETEKEREEPTDGPKRPGER